MSQRNSLASSPKSLRYEIRVACFIDILGFTKVISGTVGPGGKVITENVQRLVDVFTFIHKSLDLDEPYDQKESTRITQFSDSVVISFLYSEESGVFYTLLRILDLLIGLISHGLICRGGISLGWLLHTEQLLFGPALINAYLLESKAANHPRVILGENIIALSEGYRAEHHTAEQEKDYVLELVKKDSDGMYYIDYIGEAAYGELDDPVEDYPVYLHSLSQIIARGLQTSDPSERVKYGWLRERYNAALEKCKQAYQVTGSHDPEIIAAYEKLDFL